MCIRDSPLSPLPLYKGTITALLQSLGTIPSINALLHNFKIQSIRNLPLFLIISPVISSIPADLPFFNYLTLPISSSLLITSSPKYLFLLAPSNPHTQSLSPLHYCQYYTDFRSVLFTLPSHPFHQLQKHHPYSLF